MVFHSESHISIHIECEYSQLSRNSTSPHLISFQSVIRSPTDCSRSRQYEFVLHMTCNMCTPNLNFWFSPRSYQTIQTKFIQLDCGRCNVVRKLCLIEIASNIITIITLLSINIRARSFQCVASSNNITWECLDNMHEIWNGLPVVGLGVRVRVRKKSSFSFLLE